MKKFNKKDLLLLGAFLLVFGIILYFAGGGYADYTKSSISNYLDRAENAINNYDFDNAVYYRTMAELAMETYEFDMAIVFGMQLIGAFMVVCSFLVLLAGILRKEKISSNRYCPGCGRAIPETANFCPYCKKDFLKN